MDLLPVAEQIWKFVIMQMIIVLATPAENAEVDKKRKFKSARSKLKKK